MSLIDELPAKYNDLNQAINAANFEVGKVLMINYPNMLFGKERKLCDGNMLNGNTSINCLDPGIQLFGHIEFFREVHTALNESIREACDKFKWEPIRVSAINKHGICNCEEPYFNSIPQSIWDRRDANGAIHPNKKWLRQPL
ncbi:MAG: hypothetical protein IPN36_14775 [Bacteroidetes bacterium]|nr:hypothetical protein [Bacteroidota bacterium]